MDDECKAPLLAVENMTSGCLNEAEMLQQSTGVKHLEGAGLDVGGAGDPHVPETPHKLLCCPQPLKCLAGKEVQVAVSALAPRHLPGLALLLLPRLLLLL